MNIRRYVVRAENEDAPPLLVPEGQVRYIIPDHLFWKTKGDRDPLSGVFGFRILGVDIIFRVRESRGLTIKDKSCVQTADVYDEQGVTWDANGVPQGVIIAQARFRAKVAALTNVDAPPTGAKTVGMMVGLIPNTACKIEVVTCPVKEKVLQVAGEALPIPHGIFEFVANDGKTRADPGMREGYLCVSCTSRDSFTVLGRRVIEMSAAAIPVPTMPADAPSPYLDLAATDTARAEGGFDETDEVFAAGVAPLLPEVPAASPYVVPDYSDDESKGDEAKGDEAKGDEAKIEAAPAVRRQIEADSTPEAFLATIQKMSGERDLQLYSIRNVRDAREVRQDWLVRIESALMAWREYEIKYLHPPQDQDECAMAAYAYLSMASSWRKMPKSDGIAFSVALEYAHVKALCSMAAINSAESELERKIRFVKMFMYLVKGERSVVERPILPSFGRDISFINFHLDSLFASDPTFALDHFGGMMSSAVAQKINANAAVTSQDGFSWSLRFPELGTEDLLNDGVRQRYCAPGFTLVLSLSQPCSYQFNNKIIKSGDIPLLEWKRNGDPYLIDHEGQRQPNLDFLKKTTIPFYKKVAAGLEPDMKSAMRELVSLPAPTHSSSSVAVAGAAAASALGVSVSTMPSSGGETDQSRNVKRARVVGTETSLSASPSALGSAVPGSGEVAVSSSESSPSSPSLYRRFGAVVGSSPPLLFSGVAASSDRPLLLMAALPAPVAHHSSAAFFTPLPGGPAVNPTADASRKRPRFSTGPG